MADFGNQLEDTSSSLERLTDGFDNLMIRMTSSSTKESKMLQEKLAISKQLGKIEAAKLKEEKKATPLRKKMVQELQTRLRNTTLLNKGLKETASASATLCAAAKASSFGFPTTKFSNVNLGSKGAPKCRAV